MVNKMTYATRDNGHIRTFSPDDTSDTMYIETYGIDIDEILSKANEKWPGIQNNEITIHAEHIQTDCLGYDQYDVFDYTDFIVVEASAEYIKRTAS
jgi:hypothetical protein